MARPTDTDPGTDTEAQADREAGYPASVVFGLACIRLALEAARGIADLEQPLAALETQFHDHGHHDAVRVVAEALTGVQT